MRGHVSDPAAAPTSDGLARCLRCDAWVARDHAAFTTLDGPLPRRGKELHEAILMRLVALDRAFHAVILLLVAGALTWLWLRLPGLAPQARSLSEQLSGLSSSIGHLGGTLNSAAKHVAGLHTDRIRNLALVCGAYGVLEGTEAVGLWLEQRWAEYLTVVATAGLLPLEVSEILKNATAVKLGGFVVNIAVVAFLVWTKRLFGVRRKR